MNNKQQTAHTICIPEEELPVRANMRVIRRTDPNYGMSDDDVADRNEFIRCYLMREFESLLMIDSDRYASNQEKMNDQDRVYQSYQVHVAMIVNTDFGAGLN